MGASTNTRELKGRRVAILATNGFEQSELLAPLEALQDAGADVSIISLPDTGDTIRGWDHDDWGEDVKVDGTVRNHTDADFDALVLPGGVMNPDALRMDEEAVSFVRAFFDGGKPVAAICHGPWMLVEADVARDRKVTSYPSIRTDLVNAGAEWVDEEVVVDAGLVTSRSPEDMDAFVDKMIEEIREGVHAAQHA
jgi:protease I